MREMNSKKAKILLVIGLVIIFATFAYYSYACLRTFIGTTKSVSYVNGEYVTSVRFNSVSVISLVGILLSVGACVLSVFGFFFEDASNFCAGVSIAAFIYAFVIRSYTELYEYLVMRNVIPSGNLTVDTYYKICVFAKYPLFIVGIFIVLIAIIVERFHENEEIRVVSE